MKTIRQTATICGATPHDVYETIMDSKNTKPSGSRNTVSRRVFGHIQGSDVTLKERTSR